MTIPEFRRKQDKSFSAKRLVSFSVLAQLIISLVLHLLYASETNPVDTAVVYQPSDLVTPSKKEAVTPDDLQICNYFLIFNI